MWHFHADWMKSALMGGAILLAELRLRVYVGGCQHCCCLYVGSRIVVAVRGLLSHRMAGCGITDCLQGWAESRRCKCELLCGPRNRPPSCDKEPSLDVVLSVCLRCLCE